jgi:serine/threonine protein kinase
MLEAGRVLGRRYEIISEIGSGGMANVYKARDQKLDRLVAIKVLKQEFTMDNTILEKFRKEALAAGGLNHPNIVSVYDMGHELGSEYIVMELIDGITLKEYIRKRGHLTSEEIIKISIRVAEALKAAHENGIIHRDIKPQNIMVTPSGEVKVTDFGIAKGVSSTTVTASGETLGSVHYLSPEQARGSKVDARSDLYSLGITMYEMATSQLPFTADTPVAVAMKQLNEMLPNPMAKAPDLWPGLADIIIRLTQKRPDARYQSAADLIVDMKRLYQNPALRLPRVTGSAPRQPVKNGQYPSSHTRREVRSDTQNTRMPGLMEEERRRAENARRRELERQRRKKRKQSVITIAILSVIAVIALVVLLWLLIRNGKAQMSPDSSQTVIESSIESKAGSKSDSSASEISTESSDSEASTEVETMPSMSGITYEEAQQIAADHNLTISVEAENNDSVQAGNVISQEPLADQPVPDNRVVILHVSLGAQNSLAQVPPVEGMTQDEAVAALTNAMLTPGEITTAYSDSVAKGVVISQGIESGSQVSSGTAVDLTVSLGPEETSKSQTTNAGSVTITQPFSKEDDQGMLVVMAYDADGQATVIYQSQITYKTFSDLGGSLTVNYPAGTTRIAAVLNGETILDESISN